MFRTFLAFVVLAFGCVPAEATGYGPVPTRPPALACDSRGCIFGPDGQMHDGWRFSATSSPQPGAYGWWEHVSYQPPGTTFRVRLCIGEFPYRTDLCGPAAEMVTPQPRTVEDIIRSHFAGTVGDQAMRVARCESGLRPDARSPDGSNHGLFQINNVHAARFPAVTGRPWSTGRYEAEANTVYARWLYGSSGWGPWACRP